MGPSPANHNHNTRQANRQRREGVRSEEQQQQPEQQQPQQPPQQQPQQQPLQSEMSSNEASDSPAASGDENERLRRKNNEQRRRIDDLSIMMQQLAASVQGIANNTQQQHQNIVDLLGRMAETNIHAEEIRRNTYETDKQALRENLETMVRSNLEATKEMIREAATHKKDQDRQAVASYVTRVIGGEHDLEIDEQGEKALKRYLAIEPKSCYEKIPLLSNDLIDLVPWKAAADNWMKASRFDMLLKLDEDKLSHATSPYLVSKNSELYSMLLTKLNSPMKLKLQRDVKEDGAKAWRIVDQHFEQNRKGIESRYHDEMKTIPDISNINDASQLLDCMEKKLRLNDELGIMKFAQHWSYECISSEVFEDLKKSVISDMRLYVTVEEAGSASRREIAEQRCMGVDLEASKFPGTDPHEENQEECQGTVSPLKSTLSSPVRSMLSYQLRHASDVGGGTPTSGVQVTA